MSRWDHDQVMGILAEAMELPEARRRDFLDSTCSDQPELRREVEQLLSCAPRAVQAFDSASERLVREDPEKIGPYTILKPVGEGGMAVVYKAAQHHPVRRIVAIKLIKLGMDTRKFVTRFESERQALAMMDHANVAKVFDAGSTETGRPYFVMEYVPGRPILDYCDAHQLTLKQRLELFIQVCDAIEHAHRRGIIHRDLKNSNVLVTDVDGCAVPKVIDFGVAKAIYHPLTDGVTCTEHGQLIGTPEYMSPEQAERGALDIDTRSDIYSLGVLLYELLAGAHPILSPSSSAESYEQLQQLIRESEPARPATRLSQMHADQNLRIATARRTSPPKLIAELHGELSWIPLKAIRKSREQRYRSAAELGDDIRNYLSARPLIAGPETTRYRVSKFVRRHRTTVAAGVAVGATLLVGAVVCGILAIQLMRKADATRAALEQAEAANANSDAVIEFLTDDVIGSADPAVTRGKELTVKEAIEKAAKSVEKFRDRPIIEAAVRDALALTYRSLGRADQGLEHACAAVELRRRELGADHPETLNALSTLASLLRRLGNFVESESLCREVLRKRRQLFGEDDPRTLSSLSDLALVLQDRGRFDEAEQIARDAVDRHRRVLGDSHPHTQTSLNNLGLLLQRRGNFSAAEPFYRRVLTYRRQKLGDDHPSTLISINNLSGLLQDMGRLQEAEPLAREALVRSRKVLGADHPYTLVAINNLVTLLADLHRYDEAEPLARELLSKARRQIGEGHPQTITMMRNLAGLLRAQGNRSEASELLREAATLSNHSSGEPTTTPAH